MSNYGSLAFQTRELKFFPIRYIAYYITILTGAIKELTLEKIGINNFRLPTKKLSGINSEVLLPPRKLEELKSIACPRVVDMTLRAVGRAELYDSRHPFWNSIANSYINILQRIETLRETFPDIKRVIHNSEIIRGDILVSDFQTGLNFGQFDAGDEPTKMCVLEKDGDILAGKVLRPGCEDSSEIGFFQNEIWFFISHRFTVISNKHAAYSRTPS